MSLVTDRCICLRKVEYSETSQILLLFGRNQGLVRLIARGAHRVTKAGASKFGGGIDLLDVGEAVFTDRPEKELATLTEWKLREGHPQLRRNLRALYLGFYAAELSSSLIQEHDPHPELFDRLEQVLLELGSPRTEQAFLAFQIDLLRESGYLPELTTCAGCARPVSERSAAAFSLPDAGILCRGCEGAYPQRIPVNGRLLAIMQYVMSIWSSDSAGKRLPVLTRHQTDPINRLLVEHIQYTLGRRLRMARWVTPWRE